MATWFTADTHFGHGGALGLFRRPFSGVAAMDEAMIARWRECVAPDDDVWHLGDVAVGVKPDRLDAILSRLSGHIRLVAGNNDDAVRNHPRWAEVTDYAETMLEGTALVLCHYPLRSWRGQHRGAWNLHGHSHHTLKPLTRQRDAGVDGHDLAPVSLDGLKRFRWPGRRDRDGTGQAGLGD